MNLIDRYLQVVTSHLSVEMREDVRRELQTNIEDMLSSEPSEEEIYSMLEKLGNPITLAAGYSDKKRYLIGTELYDQYLSLLKSLMGIIPAVLGLITLLVGLITFFNDTDVVTLFTSVFTAVIQGVMQVFFWVTLAFLVIEHTGINEGKLPFVKKKWTPNDLVKEEVSHKRKISRIEILMGMTFTIVLLAVLKLNQNLIGWFSVNSENGNVTLVEPIFDNDRLKIYFYVIIIIASLSLLVNLWKFITPEWNLTFAILNACHNLVIGILFIVMVTDDKLINPNFYKSLSTKIHDTVGIDIEIWSFNFLMLFIVVFILICLIDSLKAFRKIK